MKQERFQSYFKIEELNIGDEVIDGITGQIAVITDKTKNSIESYITADKKSVKTKGKSNIEKFYDSENDMVDVGQLKGISYKNWFGLDQFNRRFKRK